MTTSLEESSWDTSSCPSISPSILRQELSDLISGSSWKRSSLKSSSVGADTMSMGGSRSGEDGGVDPYSDGES
jgi:hypothetical protein